MSFVQHRAHSKNYLSTSITQNSPHFDGHFPLNFLILCSFLLCVLQQKGHYWYWSAILIVSAQENSIKKCRDYLPKWQNSNASVVFRAFLIENNLQKLCLITNFHLAFVSAPDICPHWDRFAFSCNLKRWSAKGIFFIQKSIFGKNLIVPLALLLQHFPLSFLSPINGEGIWRCAKSAKK